MTAPLICFEDSAFLAINKPSGMPAQPDLTGDLSLLCWAEQYTGQALHAVNRLDRPVSGLMLLAKTAQVMAHLQQQFREGSVEKVYAAAVEGKPPEESGVLIHYLTRHRHARRVYASLDERPEAVRAELRYRLIGRGERYCFLLVQPLTGRHHQIRAQLAAIGCPVKGDVRYGARRANRDRSIHLHAWKLAFTPPGLDQRLCIEAPLPEGDALWSALSEQLLATSIE